ncbi:SHIRT domain-containing protein [Streptococcus pluranimalium]|uniref:SHIRT domain-containing protein n=1 Tax=Streptococcus pluranimalium TaxID=82348 RepID=UPI004046CCFD
MIVANGNTYELISTKTENPTGVINPLVNVGDVISVGTDANYVIRYELLDQSGTLSWKLLKPDGTQAVAVRDGEATSGIITAGQTTFVTVIVDERVGHRDVSGGEVTYYINNPYFPGGKTTYYYRLTEEASKKSTVVHEFVSGTPGKDLPKEVTDLTPAPKSNVPYGGEETPVAPTTTTVEVTDGTWSFESYDKLTEVVDQPEEKFTGTWVFTPKEEPVTEQSVTTHVDENGTPLLPQEDGTQPVREIPGYEPVKTTTDEPVNTTHFYRPVTPVTEQPDVQLANKKVQAKSENTYVSKTTVLPETGDTPTAHFVLEGLALLGLGLAVGRRKKLTK